MPHIRTALSIAAPPARVWSILADVRGWPRWTTIMRDCRGVARAGDPIAFRIAIPGLPVLPIQARVVRAEPERALAWRGGVPGVLVGEHALELEPEGQGTRLLHHERFEGVLARAMIAPVAGRIERAYATLNEELRVRVERAGAIEG